MSGRSIFFFAAVLGLLVGALILVDLEESGEIARPSGIVPPIEPGDLSGVQIRAGSDSVVAERRPEVPCRVEERIEQAMARPVEEAARDAMAVLVADSLLS